MNKSEDQSLFVYGTLAPGQKNEHFLKRLNGQWQSAITTGYLYSNGLGSTLGYPALDIEGGDIIPGLLFSSSELKDMWLELDEFEGEGYCRKTIWVSIIEDQILSTFEKTNESVLSKLEEENDYGLLQKVPAWVYALDQSCVKK